MGIGVFRKVSDGLYMAGLLKDEQINRRPM
jgi:hypothetical protein